MSALSTHLKSVAADVGKAAETIGALEAERNYYRNLCQRLAKLIRSEDVTYADRVEIEGLAERVEL